MASTKKSAFRSEQMARVLEEAKFRMRQAKPPERSEIPKAYGGTARQFNHPLERGRQPSLRRSAQQVREREDDYAIRQQRSASFPKRAASVPSSSGTGGAKAPDRLASNPQLQQQRAKLISQLDNQQRMAARSGSAPKRIAGFGQLKRRNRRAPARSLKV